MNQEIRLAFKIEKPKLVCQEVTLS